MTDAARRDLAAVLDRVTTAAVRDADTALASSALGAAERRAVSAALADVLSDVVLARTARLLVVELRAASAAGALTADTPQGRWDQWVRHAVTPSFWAGVERRYPTLGKRLATLTANRAAAAVEFATRFAADRALVAELTGPDPELVSVAFGAGDSHRGGRTVATATTTRGTVVYKPRSLAVDQALDDLLAAVLPGTRRRIAVPEVRTHATHGWAAFVEHRHCADDAELSEFYLGVGHWLAVARLLGATDLHAENVVAVGPVPMVVDCETLFSPRPVAPSSGYGDAADRAAHLLRGSVLRTGLLPGRSTGLGHRGADVSAAGAVPSEQPPVGVTALLDLGTDRARLAQVPGERVPPRNLPAPDPDPAAHWSQVVRGFTELTGALRALDARSGLWALLAPLTMSAPRVVRRDTIVYTELGAMLWHPASLREEPLAVARARDLLARNAEVTPGAPADPVEIDAEIADLLRGDVPLFTVGDPTGAAVSALADWRGLDIAVETQVTRCSVLSARREEDVGQSRSLIPQALATRGLDRRRRALAASLVSGAVDAAIHGRDGTVTWVSPALSPVGLAVRPLASDFYSGLPGVAVMLAAYRREAAAGHADPVSGVDDLLTAVVRSMETVEDRLAAERGATARPEAPGCYVGLASRVWSWLLLADLGAVDPDHAVDRCERVAADVPAAVAADEFLDLLIGRAGAVVPLLRLAARTGRSRWRDMAVDIADGLVGMAVVDGGTARWPGTRSADGLGGFAHGAMGIGWALAVLGAETGVAAHTDTAARAFAFQESLRTDTGWRDLRKPGTCASSWCHGSAGVAIAAADLRRGDPATWSSVLGFAAAEVWARGFGVTHTLCHGDLGSWEVIELARAAGVTPREATAEAVAATVISGMEEFGPRAAMTTTLYRPGLLSGMGGMAYQLLRLRPGCGLPSVLLPDPGGDWR